MAQSAHGRERPHVRDDRIRPLAPQVARKGERHGPVPAAGEIDHARAVGNQIEQVPLRPGQDEVDRVAAGKEFLRQP